MDRERNSMVRGSMLFSAGCIRGTVTGGPYQQRPPNVWGVNLAKEIEDPCKVKLPIKDFSIPSYHDYKTSLLKVLMAITNKEDVHIGCMGGLGRTGLFIAGLAKVKIEYAKVTGVDCDYSDKDPVSYVRSTYDPHAVETLEQLNFINKLDVGDLVQWCIYTNAILRYGSADYEPSTTKLNIFTKFKIWVDKLVQRW